MRAVEHVRGWPFGPDDALLVEGSPIAVAALAWARATELAPGATASVAAVFIGADGELSHQTSLQVERLSATRWRVGDASPVDVDPDGLPLLDGGSSQPLEQP